MSGRLLLTFAFALLVFPFFASASTCPNLKHNLSFGSRGQDVIELQNFLIAQHDLATGNNTGYFGRLTESAVKKFQRRSNIVSSGTPSTTGYGAVGPKTRMRIKTACSASPTTSPPAQCINPPPPNLSCDGQWKKFFNKNRCHVGWTCVVTQATTPEINKAPFISTIIGPTLLKTNVNGTWKITARDPENNTLAYSVIWGDEGRYVSQLLNIIQEGTSYSATTNISHTYKKTGDYIIVVFAKDTGGNIVKATLSINVYEPVNQAAPSSIKIGGRVKATVNLKVRSRASIYGNVLGEQARGARGTVTGGAVTADGYTWWKINWNSGPDGWSVQDYLEKIAPARNSSTSIDGVTASQMASEAQRKASAAVRDANNARRRARDAVTRASGLHILPGTLPGAVFALNSAIATARGAAASAVMHAEKALAIAREAQSGAATAIQFVNQGRANESAMVAKKALIQADSSLRISRAVGWLADIVELVGRLLIAV